MGKKNRHNQNRQDMLEFETENSEAADLSATEGSATVREEKMAVQEAEIEKIGEKEITASDKPAAGAASDGMIDEKESVMEKPLTEKQKNRRIDTYIEFVLILILGILIGIAVKTEAEKRITIGFDDYQMKIVRQDFDINKIQAEVTLQSVEESKAQVGESVSEEDGSSQDEE